MQITTGLLCYSTVRGPNGNRPPATIKIRAASEVMLRLVEIFSVSNSN